MHARLSPGGEGQLVQHPGAELGPLRQPGRLRVESWHVEGLCGLLGRKTSQQEGSRSATIMAVMTPSLQGEPCGGRNNDKGLEEKRYKGSCSMLRLPWSSKLPGPARHARTPLAHVSLCLWEPVAVPGRATTTEMLTCPHIIPSLFKQARGEPNRIPSSPA